MVAYVCGYFGVLALTLAAIGLYGLMAYAVAQRTREGKIVYERGAPAAASQDTTIYDLLFKHAQIAGSNEESDIGIVGNRIARIGRGLKAAHARVLVEADGYQVTPAALAEGAPANVAVLDAGRTIMTVRNGRIITDDEGLSIPDVSCAGPYSNFK